MKCDHCEVKRFVCLMYNCTDLNICAFCSSDKLLSPNSKASISKLSRNCRLFVNCSRASTYKQHSQISSFPRVLRLSPPLKLTTIVDVTEILLKVALNTITLTITPKLYIYFYYYVYFRTLKF
jgi:hypothetical protein